MKPKIELEKVKMVLRRVYESQSRVGKVKWLHEGFMKTQVELDKKNQSSWRGHEAQNRAGKEKTDFIMGA